MVCTSPLWTAALREDDEDAPTLSYLQNLHSGFLNSSSTPLSPFVTSVAMLQIQRQCQQCRNGRM